MRRSLILLVVLALGLLSAAPALAAQGGVPGSPVVDDLIWADGELFGTIPQKALKFNGNVGSYDHLYLFSGDGAQNPLSEAAPGNRDYNGGRWIPTPVEYDGSRGTLTSYEDLMDAVEAGAATIGDPQYDAAFLCPLVPSP